MEPPDKGKNDESLSKKNRDLLRLEAQEKRRREALGEKDQFPGKTPIFAKPYKTDNKDALSKRIRNVLGDYNDFKEYMRKNLRKVIWSPKKFKSRSQTRSKCHELSSSQTKTFQSSVTEQPRKNSKASESSELEPSLEKTNSTDVPSIEDILREMTYSFSRPVSPLQSPPKAEPAKLPCSTEQTNSTDVPSIEDILREMTYSFSRPVSPLKSPPKAEPSKLPCSTKQTNSTDVPSIEDILREMTYSFSRPVSPLQSPPKAEPSKLPCSTKGTDGSAAQNQEQSGTASGTLPSSQPRTSFSWLPNVPQLSDSEESDDNQVLEKPPSALAPPRYSVLVDDLQLSDSEESDDNQVAEKPPSALVSPRDSALQSQPRSVASSPSSSSETSDSESSVDWETVYSESSSDSEMETTLSGGDVSDPPIAPAPEGTDGSAAQNQEQSGTASGTSPSSQPRTSVLIDDLQLSDSEESDDNQVVEKPPSPLGGPRSLQSSSSESGSTSDSESSSDSETSDSESSSSPETSDSESSSGSETHHTGGVKRPGKPLVDNGVKRCRKEDSNPDPLEIRAQSSRDKQRVKKRAKSTYRKDLKPALQEPHENRKGSQQAKVKQPFALRVKKLLSPVRDPAAPEPVRVKEEHQRRAETKDLPGARKWDLKRRAMDSPDEPSGKKKRGEI
ncbi:AF4/FMR2 family member 1-like isoform X6 [Manacus candei]|uniref:AF4/FMR2 family member 1-like isoform X3 n=1 Tax=Manacus candei TaxID=415023 RepID=UPI002227A931|nr:AF4/FMR2 family member 1-like isoform X3 [Manacus candei]XP_051624089.1 AF4/FMR2 family member 1-like isoform X4 [Manacus candei]XP_051624090.1 AF4/FMR2 family member 1-like isoform X5 [Manacus candei]XP_051624091.1 AF4/FMR2 family member 1-like isoform X6 [Manacus candei]